MEVVIFGATGRTGSHLVDGALERGHTVRAFTRSPGKLERDRPGLHIFVGDVQDPDAVGKSLAGADAVLSALGPTANTPDHQVSTGTRHISTAMQDHGVRRLIVTAGAGVHFDEDAPGIVDHAIRGVLRIFARHVYEDMRRTVGLVRGSSLDWTVVRVPMLVDGPSRGTIRVGYVGRDTGSRIARADVAKFILDELETGGHVRDAPVISN